MTTASLNSGYDLARLYSPPTGPFRLKKSTAIALAVAVAFHGAVGFYVVKSRIEQAQITYIPEKVIKLLPTEMLPPPPLKTDAPRHATPPRFHLTPVVNPVAPDPLIVPTTLADSVAPTGPVTTLDPTPVPVAAVTPTPSPIIRNPSWLRKPTPDQVSRLYPNRAAERGVTGGATLMCEVLASGDVNNCTVIDESPKAYRFGEAALAMSKYFRLNPRTVDGTAQDGVRVRIPIVFNLN